jgi:hypothetical protein
MLKAKMKVLTWVALGVPILLGLSWILRTAKERHDVSALLSNAHLLEKLIWVYRQDHAGQYPESLDLIRGDGDPILGRLFPPEKGYVIRYAAPAIKGSNDDVVFIIIHHRESVICTRNKGVRFAPWRESGP